jgi:chaperone BCS1
MRALSLYRVQEIIGSGIRRGEWKFLRHVCKDSAVPFSHSFLRSCVRVAFLPFRFIQVRREREKSMIDLQSGSPWETVTLTSMGRDREIFRDILNEARLMAMKKQAGKTLIYTAWGTEWKQFGSGRNKRPLTSVLLPPSLGESLLSDVQEFTRSQAWYLERGIPYRRGYLLYGPPGCGKSSYIFALAGELNYNIAILNLNDKGLTDDRLNILLSVVPPRTIVLLEDVDAAFTKERVQQTTYSVTFSGLLNALDGVASTEERVIFMTTNHLERLDPALVRPGRVDVKLEIGYAQKHQISGMFLRFFPGCELEATRFVQIVEAACEKRKRDRLPANLSMAELQGFFLVHKHSMQGALEHAESIHDAQKQMAVAASLVRGITAAAAAAGPGASPSNNTPKTPGTVERIIAMPDPPVDPAVVAQHMARIAAQEAEEAREAAASAQKT